MKDQDSKTTSLLAAFPPVHSEGIKFVVIAGILALISFLWVSVHLGWILVGLTIWVAAFFRDPVRVVPQGDALIISPADGKVCLIADVIPPAELDLGAEPLTRVSIFMNVFNVHINRAPIAGTIRRRVYIPGKFLNADLDKASEENERQLFTVRTASGVDIGFIQIAGLVARRILGFSKEGDTVAAGQRVGLIRFGSRVDVFLPKGTTARVAVGQTMVAGETVLGVVGEAVVMTGQAL
jgi:phosphatidylserine decarboxylase